MQTVFNIVFILVCFYAGYQIAQYLIAKKNSNDNKS